MRERRRGLAGEWGERLGIQWLTATALGDVRYSEAARMTYWLRSTDVFQPLHIYDFRTQFLSLAGMV